MNDSYIDDRKLHEECGVFGAYDFDCGDVASTIYYGLLAQRTGKLWYRCE